MTLKPINIVLAGAGSSERPEGKEKFAPKAMEICAKENWR